MRSKLNISKYTGVLVSVDRGCLGIRTRGGSRYRYNYSGSRYPYRGLGISTKATK